MSESLDRGAVSPEMWADGESRSRELMRRINECYVAPEVIEKKYGKKSAVGQFYNDQNERIVRLKTLRLFLDRFKETYHLYRFPVHGTNRSNKSGEAETVIDLPHQYDASASESRTPEFQTERHCLSDIGSRGNSEDLTSDVKPLLEPGNYKRRSQTFEAVARNTASYHSFLTPRDYYHIAYLQDQNDQLVDMFDQVKPNSTRAIWTVRITFYINVLLTLLRSLAAIRSGSLAVFASTLEGCLDIVSNAIVFFTQMASGKMNYLEYPTGRSRMEPLGVMLFAAITATSTFQIFVKAVDKLTKHENDEVHMEFFDGLLLGVVIITKLFLWLWSRRIKESLSCLALAQDHFNDVLSNTLTTVFAYVATYYEWWIDPVGALIIATIIMKNWVVVCLHYAQLLTGRSANQMELNDLAFLVLNFEPAFISYVDTVRAYHVGINLFAEIDIVLPPKIELEKAHDIGESLQVMIEKLPHVERAFVHLDTNDTHVVEHQWDKTRLKAA